MKIIVNKWDLKEDVILCFL